jgi:hypothetical protein
MARTEQPVHIADLQAGSPWPYLKSKSPGAQEQRDELLSSNRFTPIQDVQIRSLPRFLLARSISSNAPTAAWPLAAPAQRRFGCGVLVSQERTAPSRLSAPSEVGTRAAPRADVRPQRDARDLANSTFGKFARIFS